MGTSCVKALREGEHGGEDAGSSGSYTLHASFSA